MTPTVFGSPSHDNRTDRVQNFTQQAPLPRFPQRHNLPIIHMPQFCDKHRKIYLTPCLTETMSVIHISCG